MDRSKIGFVIVCDDLNLVFFGGFSVMASCDWLGVTLKVFERIPNWNAQREKIGNFECYAPGSL